MLTGIHLTLKGHHAENGAVVCEGQATMVVKGGVFGNPLGIAGAALAALGLIGIVAAGRPRFTKVAPAFEDSNPG